MNTGGGGYNWGWVHRNDGGDIEGNADPEGLPFNVGWTDVGEWMGYTIEDVTAGTYDVTLANTSNSFTDAVEITGQVVEIDGGTTKLKIGTSTIGGDLTPLTYEPGGLVGGSQDGYSLVGQTHGFPGLTPNGLWGDGVTVLRTSISGSMWALGRA